MINLGYEYSFKMMKNNLKVCFFHLKYQLAQVKISFYRYTWLNLNHVNYISKELFKTSQNFSIYLNKIPVKFTNNIFRAIESRVYIYLNALFLIYLFKRKFIHIHP
jgi:hypothetical protein